LTNKSQKVATSGNADSKELKKTQKMPEVSTDSPALASASATKSNGSCSDASVSSELEALLPSVDHFKEEERTQWEPLCAEKFPRQKNTPR
jgi:PH/SEC7 domain-containing protein